MKTTFTSLMILLSVAFVKAQNLELPFYEDFEESISSDATFLNWTTENLAGWQYWHIVTYQGVDGSQCMRFENNDLDQNDWLITKAINTGDADSLLIRFYSLYNYQGTKPELLYTTEYSGDASNDIWTEIEYELGENTGQWYSSGDIKIKAPESAIWFAFHSSQDANKGIYFLLDNFSVSKYDPVRITKAGETENFEFYTDNEADTNYWLEIKDALEERYKVYCGHWNRPGREVFMDKSKKTKVYLFERTNITQITEDTPDWKQGFFDRDNYSLYLENSVLKSGTAENSFYDGLKGLALHTFAGYAVKHRILRDGLEDYLPWYFVEGFGLYEQGYRPNRDSVISYLNQHPETLSHDIFMNLENITTTSEKDILTAHYEWSTLFGGYCEIYWHYGEIPETEKKFFYHFYEAPDEIRIRKYGESENFDIYCSPQDTTYIDSMKVWLERTRAFYCDSFQMDIAVRYPLLSMKDEQTGMELTGYDDFNGGSASINLSPVVFGIKDYPWLLAHEFGHVYNSLMYYNFPPGFYHEGMANFSGFIQCNADWMESKWFIEWALYYFNQEHEREPYLEEYINNPFLGTVLELDPYYHGLVFFRYLYENFGLMRIKEFIQQGFNFDVFERPYQQIEKEFLIRLKRNANLYPQKMEPLPIPFNERFQELSAGWTKPNYLNENNWNIKKRGSGDISCVGIYVSSNKNTAIESWLVSPPFNTKDKDELNFSFDFSRFGEGFEIQVLYSNQFNGLTDSTSWSVVKNVDIPDDWDWSNSGNFKIMNPPDTTFIALKCNLTGEQHQQLYIDNFIVNGIATTIEVLTKNQTDLHIYPNPVTNDSKISFNLKKSENVELAIFDMQGKKLSVIANQKMLAGSYVLPFGKYISMRGIYLCRLTTGDSASIIKFEVR